MSPKTRSEQNFVGTETHLGEDLDKLLVRDVEAMTSRREPLLVIIRSLDRTARDPVHPNQTSAIHQ